jgi:putative Flp pilus-assembly TadE/G-like protein
MRRFHLRSVQAEAGQVLPLAALMMVALIAIVGLAIDVSQAFTEQRWERSITDSASLAGGQDLQRPGRLLPAPAQRTAARITAMHVLATELRATSEPLTGSGSPCLTATGCALPGTPYRASIYAGVEAGLPSPTCLDCVPERAVQVTLWQPSFGLTFSRILGFKTWNVKAASTAGVVFARQYGVVTLRPTDPRGPSDGNEKDLQITGGSKVLVGDGDIVTNTNAVCAGSNSEIDLDAAAGFAVYHYDPYEAWGGCINPPPGVQVTSPIDDPGYSIPQRSPATPPIATYANVAQAMGTDPGGPNPDPNYTTRCAAQQASVPPLYHELKTGLQINNPAQVIANCVRPGIYQFLLDAKDNSSGPPVAWLLEPGVYFFDYGVNVQSTLIGGYVHDQPGVALVLLEAKNQSGTPGQMTTANSTSLLSLNFGDAYLNPGGHWATAASGPQGLVSTPNPGGVLLTLMVEPDRVNCLPVTATESTACKNTENDRNTLKLTGGGNIFLAGVQYAPTDNVNLKGNSGQEADVGAMWAWTIKFDASVFNIQTANPELIGVLRLDRACSPGNICN